MTPSPPQRTSPSPSGGEGEGFSHERPPRLRDVYRKKVVAELMKQFGYQNSHECPQIKKIIINVGISEAREDIKAVDQVVLDLSAMTGQKPRVTRAKKSISNFKLRENMPIGAFVTLRGNRMYEFLDRLITCALPRLRDFRGLLVSSLDGRGSLNIGLTEQYIFPEINPDKSPKVRGMNISIVTTAQDDERARTILSLLGMPFRKEKMGVRGSLLRPDPAQSSPGSAEDKGRRFDHFAEVGQTPIPNPGVSSLS